MMISVFSATKVSLVLEAWGGKIDVELEELCLILQNLMNFPFVFPGHLS